MRSVLLSVIAFFTIQTVASEKSTALISSSLKCPSFELQVESINLTSAVSGKTISTALLVVTRDNGRVNQELVMPNFDRKSGSAWVKLNSSLPDGPYQAGINKDGTVKVFAAPVGVQGLQGDTAWEAVKCEMAAASVSGGPSVGSPLH